MRPPSSRRVGAAGSGETDRPPAERGTSTVEFALVLPLVLVVALALMQVGLFLVDQLIVVEAARSGAREAAVTTDEARVRGAALRAGPWLAEERTAVAVDRTGGIGDPVTVRVRYRAEIVVPLVDWLFPGSVELEGAATMRQEMES
ncbi:MAG TPA: TadE/TadG family type IV pilus assembly protein [Actinomycetota bacterium]|nr:TadE/TadG family type IV pilus assembly protein [Actinomycetota bacterium]